MAGDNIRIRKVFTLKVLDSFLRYKLMRSTVETVLSDLRSLVILVRYSVQFSFLGHGAVESGIEYAYVGAVYDRLAGLKTSKARGIVQRSEMRNTLEVLHCLVVDICRGRESLARVHYSVTDSRDFFRRRYAAVFFVRKALHNEVESVGMICEGLFNDVLFAVDFV